MNTKGIAYHIEQATAADASAIKRLVRGARLDPTDLRWQNFRVARGGQHILGCIQLKRYPGLQELASLVVRQRYRGQGIGQALVEEILASVAQPPVYLICPRHRRSFYQQLEFRVVDTAKQLPFLLQLRYLPGKLIARYLAGIDLDAMRWDGAVLD